MGVVVVVVVAAVAVVVVVVVVVVGCCFLCCSLFIVDVVVFVALLALCCRCCCWSFFRIPAQCPAGYLVPLARSRDRPMHCVTSGRFLGYIHPSLAGCSGHHRKDAVFIAASDK